MGQCVFVTWARELLWFTRRFRSHLKASAAFVSEAEGSTPSGNKHQGDGFANTYTDLV